MQWFGNLKVGLVFGFLHPVTAIAVFQFSKKIKILFLKIETAFSVFGLGLEAKTECLCLPRSMTTSYYVVVGTDTLL